tara:strand:- start:299 stop:499 length:201 start_codon:yes stop_codon:yes gene_type:complete
VALKSIKKFITFYTVKKLANKPFLVGKAECMQYLPESKKQQLSVLNHVTFISWVEPSYEWVINRAQ